MTLIKLAALLLAFIACLPAQYDRFGSPACSSADQELADRSFFVLCHSSSRKVALWVGYELKPKHLHGRVSRPTHFRHDTGLSGPSADDADYKYSGFSRGHMAPAADFAWSDEAIRATFCFRTPFPRSRTSTLASGHSSKLQSAGSPPYPTSSMSLPDLSSSQKTPQSSAPAGSQSQAIPTR